MERVDLSLAEDLTEVRSEIQRRVDRVTAARVELDAALVDLADGREQVLTKSAAAVAFVDAFLNPLASNPPPLEPEVAAPPPAVEPPVFTTVDTPEATPVNTSGGEAGAVDPSNVIVLPETQPTPAAVEADPVPPELAVIVADGAAAVEEHNAAAEAAAAEPARAPDADPVAPGGPVETSTGAVNVEAPNPDALVQKEPKGDPVEAVAADLANQPAGDPVGKPESV